MKTEKVENALITNASISMADHGCLTFNLVLKGNGWGCSYGGYCIAHGYKGAKEFNAKNGSGLVAMMRIMDVVGVSRWEDIPGQYVRVDVGDGWGSTITRIGNVIEDKWFDIEKFFESYKGKEDD